MRGRLEGGAVWPHVPEPATGCTVGNGEPVAVLLVKSNEQLLEIPAGVVLEF